MEQIDGDLLYTAKETPVRAGALDQPAIFALRTGRIAATAGASNFCRSFSATRQGCAAGRAGRQQVSTMREMLAAIPDATILAPHPQQPTATLPALMGVFFSACCLRQRIGRILLQLRDKGRGPGIRGEDRQSVTGAGHRDIHHPPLFRILERLLLR